MKTVLVFAGTTEGRELVEVFDRSNIACHVCVATEYGRQMIRTSDNVTVHTGRLDEEGMRQLVDEIDCDIVVDATHPFAVMVTETIKKSIDASKITYLRLLRGSDELEDNNSISYYDDIEQCVEALKKTDGNILLTTGSKQLSFFSNVSEIKDRLFARVIPGMESIKLCYDAGLEGKQIIAMQGPFSQQMNEAIIKEYDVSHLVTKESGLTGGVNEKIAAANHTGTTVHIIRRPQEVVEADTGLSMVETIKQLEQLMGISFLTGKVSVTLAGIGPGGNGTMTKEIDRAIAEANLLFGAKRMVEAVQCKAVKYPYYRKEDIIPVLHDWASNKYIDTKAVILFSGDTGFYSGSKKMYDALNQTGEFEIKILPGISSISVLGARLGIDWQDSKIISLHGISRERWIPEIMDSVKHRKKVFFITSGVDDIRLLGEILSKWEDNCTICLGYQMSYPEEQVMKLTAKECTHLNAEGLYSGFLLSKNVTPRYLVPVLEDGFFIRDKTPMTKEEVRKLSICQLKIQENDTILDIGSGSGSIAVQIAVLSPTVKVHAIECNSDAVALMKQNIEKASLHNVNVIEAMAPQGMENIPMVDAAFIGGSRGNLKEILTKLYENNPSMRVVMNAVSMETICEANQILKELNIENLSIEQISVNKVKELGNYHMLQANNPVFIYSFHFV